MPPTSAGPIQRAILLARILIVGPGSRVHPSRDAGVARRATTAHSPDSGEHCRPLGRSAASPLLEPAVRLRDPLPRVVLLGVAVVCLATCHPAVETLGRVRWIRISAGRAPTYEWADRSPGVVAACKPTTCATDRSAEPIVRVESPRCRPAYGVELAREVQRCWHLRKHCRHVERVLGLCVHRLRHSDQAATQRPRMPGLLVQHHVGPDLPLPAVAPRRRRVRPTNGTLLERDQSHDPVELPLARCRRQRFRRRRTFIARGNSAR